MKKINNLKPGHHSRSVVVGLVLSLILLSAIAVQAIASTPLDIAGYLDFSYGPSLPADMTGEKPESKLWWNDGIWWGILYNSTAGEYHIYRLDWGNQVWEDTGVIVDEREESRADVLWDAASNKLYVASHFYFTNSSRTTNPAQWGRLYRYTYDPAIESYTLDVGFPVNVNKDKTETLVLDKDSSGRLWVSYVSRDPNINPLDYQVYVNATTNPGNDTNWGTPFSLGILGTGVEGHVLVDDISSTIAFQNRIGVMWSNNSTMQYYFAIHDDSQAPQNGWTIEYPSLAFPTVQAEDHINLAKDSAGNIFAAVKTHNTLPGDPLIGMIARDSLGVYSFHVFSTYEPDYETRPIVVVNEDENKVYLFATSHVSGGRICYKAADITSPPSGITFPGGNCRRVGNNYAKTFIADHIYDSINNATSTKQTVNALTGLAVLASDDQNGQMYVHNVMGNPPPIVTQRVPGFNAIGVDITTVVTATFSKEMKEATIVSPNFKLEDSLGDVAGTVTYDALTRTATFTPDVPLQVNTVYTATLNNKIKDKSNVILYGAPEVWSFTTALPTVQFSQADYSVAENLGPATIEVTLNAPSTLPVTVDYATSDGTALAGSDYTAASGTLTFNPGETSKTFTVDFIDDVAVEGNEVLNLTLTNPVGGALGLQATASLTIVDNDTALVQFSPASFTVDESEASAEITVSLSTTSVQTVTVDYATSDGTATAGSDYTPASGTLTFAPGDTIKTFTVPILPDTIQEADEIVNLTLTNPTGGAALGAPDDKGTLTIIDDEPLPLVQFSQPAYSVNENGGNAAITVTLSAPSYQNVEVSYDATGGTATGGVDYTLPQIKTLTFAPGETSKTFNIAVQDDPLDEADETVNLSLSNLVNAEPGTNLTSILTIVDNDLPPTVQFSAGSYSVTEGAGKAVITVTLSAPSGQTVGIEYATLPGSATPGADYTTTSGTLIFSPGQTSLTFEVKILTDNVLDPNETVILDLSNPDDATLGSPSTAILTIRDKDVGFGYYLPIIQK